MPANLRETLRFKFELGHKQTSFCAASQLSDGIPNGDTGHESRNVDTFASKLNLKTLNLNTYLRLVDYKELIITSQIIKNFNSLRSIFLIEN